jgi:hypothetical protein
MNAKTVWMSASDLATILGIDVRNFHSQYAPGLAKRKEGEGMVYDAAAAVGELKRRHRPARAPRPVSPQLERMRRIAADRSQLKLDLERESHVSIRDLEDVINSIVAAVRQASETLQRRYGKEIALTYNSAIQRVNDAYVAQMQKLRHQTPAVEPGKESHE